MYRRRYIPNRKEEQQLTQRYNLLFSLLSFIFSSYLSSYRRFLNQNKETLFRRKINVNHDDYTYLNTSTSIKKYIPSGIPSTKHSKLNMHHFISKPQHISHQQTHRVPHTLLCLSTSMPHIVVLKVNFLICPQCRPIFFQLH